LLERVHRASEAVTVLELEVSRTQDGLIRGNRSERAGQQLEMVSYLDFREFLPGCRVWSVNGERSGG